MEISWNFVSLKKWEPWQETTWLNPFDYCNFCHWISENYAEKSSFLSVTSLCKLFNMQIYERIMVQFAIVVYLIVFKLRSISQNVYKYQSLSDLTLGLEHINYLFTKAEDENHFWKSLERLIKVGYDQALPGNRKWNAKCQAKCLREDNPESRREY